MAYVTLAEYRLYMESLAGIATDQPVHYTPSDDTLQTQLLASAQALIERETHRRFEAVTATRTYGPGAVYYSDPRLLMLDEDLLSVTTLTNGDGAVIAASEYRLFPYNTSPKFGIQLKSTSSWAFGDDGVVSVAGSWGYTAVADSDVKRVTCRLAYLEQQRRTATGQVAVLGDGTKTYESAVPADLAKWLASMRRHTGNPYR